MLKELVTKNRSYRNFDESYRFTREELLEFIDCARLTPASVNIQPLKYYPAWEKETVECILAQTKWAAMLPDKRLPYDGKHPTAFIVICQDTAVSNAMDKFLKDVGIAAQTMLLAAAEKGLGGCMIGNFQPGRLREVLRLPETILPMLVVALGRPDETVILEEVGPDGKTAYYRDAEDRHHVPKRRLEDVVLA